MNEVARAKLESQKERLKNLTSIGDSKTLRYWDLNLGTSTLKFKSIWDYGNDSLVWLYKRILDLGSMNCSNSKNPLYCGNYMPSHIFDEKATKEALKTFFGNKLNCKLLGE